MRDNLWLEQQLDRIWHLLFHDTPRMNNVNVRFKGRWRNKFGHIKRLNDKSTEIAINGLFRNSIVPDYIIDLTLAHELIHYSHGFHSPLPRKYKHPHKGGIVTKELKQRGFSHLLRREKDFIKREWPKLYSVLVENETFKS